MREKNGKRREKIEAATEGPNNTDIKIQEATPGVAVSFNFTNRLTIQDPRPHPQVLEGFHQRINCHGDHRKRAPSPTERADVV